jgi:hypothetical protein
MTSGMLCSLEYPIPPEAPPAPLHAHEPESVTQGWSRFAEEVDSGLVWDPDSVSQERLVIEDAIQLENRGVTSPTGPLPGPARAAPPQGELWKKQTVHKASIAAKLRVQNLDTEAAKLELCHSYYTVCLCNDCGAVRRFPNRCDLFFCPECQPALAAERKKQVEWWTRTISQPKHVVLTVRNVPDLTGRHLDELRRWFSALRRRKFARNWKGGFYTIECTHEGNGWHLHIHALVEAQWIDSAGLALQWHSITRGLGRIVKVKDCRGAAYLAEVTKYAVKGAQLAAWAPEQIATFVRAFSGKRTFGVFGSLYGARTEFAEFVATMKAARPKCDCGSCSVTYFSEAEWILRELSATGPAPSRPPPAHCPQQDLLKREFRWPD